MKIELKTNAKSVEAKLKQFEKRLEIQAEEFTEELTKELLVNIIERNPVDTGRSRASWVESLEKLDGTPPPGWSGAQPDEAAIAEGRKLSKLTKNGKKITFSSAVDYISILEFGTTSRAAVMMVRTSIRWVIARMRRRRKG